MKSDLKLHVPEVHAMKSLGYAQAFRMRVACPIKPAPVVKSRCLDHQSVALPMADRISSPCRIRVPGRFTSIQKDLAIIARGMEQTHHRGGLDDPIRSIEGLRRTQREVVDGR